MQHKGQVSVLVAPLDWGLGHATRCIPVIRELINQGAEVIIASAGPQKTLLHTEFPGLEILDLPGYSIRYKKGILLKWGLVFGAPAILNHVKRENKWLAGIMRSRKLDAVISDNRYGLYHPDLYSVFLTHQLNIRTGLGFLFDRILLKWNYKLISKFSVCWVPDWSGEISLAGGLSHPDIQPAPPVKYIGILSRLTPLPKPLKVNSLLVLLSGPEPQRTDFEKTILPQLANLILQCTLVRGLPDNAFPDSISLDGIKIINHLAAPELNDLINESDLILTRSGYSTIMDLVQLGKSAILVPTPGQTEQEYLAHHMHQMKWMLTVPEKNFNLKKSIIQFQTNKLTPPRMQEPVLGKVVAELITHCINISNSALNLAR